MPGKPVAEIAERQLLISLCRDALDTRLDQVHGIVDFIGDFLDAIEALGVIECFVSPCDERDAA